MKTLDQTIIGALKELVDAQISAVEAIASGATGAISLVTFSNGQQLCVKLADHRVAPALAAEAEGLVELRGKSSLHVPQVHAQGSAAKQAFLVLDYCKPVPHTAHDFEQLGRGLAELHANVATQYGYKQNNFIGPTPQLNTQSLDWGAFFVDRRLGCQLDLACSNDRLSVADCDKVSSMRTALIGLLNESAEPASLLHGDLWSGNILFSAAGPTLIDPAVYFGSRETDIAFTELFGGFPAVFYAAYNEAAPLAAGYEVRKRIYNLYHLLNHSNIFGAHYVSQTRAEIYAISQIIAGRT